MKRADDYKAITNLIEKLLMLLRGLVILRESPTWTCGSEFFPASPPGLAQGAGRSSVLSGVLSLLENVRRAVKYSHQQSAASCPGCVLCPVCQENSAQRVCNWETTAEKIRLFSRTFTAQNIFRTGCLSQQAELVKMK